MSAHAREDWLRLAAEAAVKEALERSVDTIDLEDEFLDPIRDGRPAQWRATVMESWRTAIADAATLLIRAERLHRRIVQGRGGGE